MKDKELRKVLVDAGILSHNFNVNTTEVQKNRGYFLSCDSNNIKRLFQRLNAIAEHLEISFNEEEPNPVKVVKKTI